MNDKDQAAIDHVASVSKNPHAAMIVKWLITGWDVRFRQGNGDMCSTTAVTWNPGTYYELIEPKPDKPAYRVYMDKDGNTFTATRYPDRTIYQEFTKDVEWLSDWIEYDQPKKWPTPLVERISAIDIKAAQWIVDNWDDLLLDDRYTRKGMYDRESNLLSHSFDWSESDIDANIWEEISTKLGE